MGIDTDPPNGEQISKWRMSIYTHKLQPYITPEYKAAVCGYRYSFSKWRMNYLNGEYSFSKLRTKSPNGESVSIPTNCSLTKYQSIRLQFVGIDTQTLNGE